MRPKALIRSKLFVVSKLSLIIIIQKLKVKSVGSSGIDEILNISGSDVDLNVKASV